jgi:TetR/AcrR family transcriptional regulator, repressor of fatR-cypB operon
MVLAVNPGALAGLDPAREERQLPGALAYSVRPSAAERSERTRKAVLDAALALFAEKGVNGTTIPDVMARAAVGASSLYRLFPSKEALANAVFREAKARLLARLYGTEPGEFVVGTAPPMRRVRGTPREVFEALWWRLVAFAREDALAFRFLELQDHAAYLDGESRQLDVTGASPLYLGFLRLQEQGLIRADMRPDAMLAIIWGALVGLIKNERLGYVRLDDATLRAAADALFEGLIKRA